MPSTFYPQSPTMDHYLLTLGTALASLYRIALTLSPGIFISSYELLEDGGNPCEQRAKRMKFWRGLATDYWQDLKATESPESLSDTAMMMAIGQLLVESPDHQLSEAVTRWIAEFLPELEYDPKPDRCWTTALSVELKVLRQSSEDLRWLYDADPEHFVTKRFPECREAIAAVLERLGKLLIASDPEAKLSVASAIVPSVHQIADAQHQAWIYDSRCSPAKPGVNGQVRRKWKQAQDKMLKLLKLGQLPKTLRQTTRQMNLNFTAVHTAAHRSAILRDHFGLSASKDTSPSGEDCLEELVRADPEVRKLIEDLPPWSLEKLRSQLKDRSHKDRLALLQTLQEPMSGAESKTTQLDEARLHRDQRRGGDVHI